MKKLLLLFFLLLPVGAMAQNARDDMSKYMEGAVPTNEAGYVYFSRDYTVTGKSRTEIFNLLKEYVQKEIVGGENHLEQARIMEAEEPDGSLVAGMEEYLYFKRKAWTMDRARFFYQLIFRISDGAFNVEMRNIRYVYDDNLATPLTYTAEKWITDAEALNKSKTKLLKVPGKFRRFTIDRKDEIFRGAAAAAGADKKVKTIEVEE